jgi:phage terminase Nu1 subunit (DNA packaging protein)
MREHVQKHGQHRDRRGRDPLEEAEGTDGWEKAAWLKAQRASLDLMERMETLISRAYVAQQLAVMASMIREALQKIPGRVAQDLEMSKADRIRSVLETEIDSALSALANALETTTIDPRAEARKGHRGTRRSRPLKLTQ